MEEEEEEEDEEKEDEEVEEEEEKEVGYVLLAMYRTHFTNFDW